MKAKLWVQEWDTGGWEWTLSVRPGRLTYELKVYEHEETCPQPYDTERQARNAGRRAAKKLGWEVEEI